MCVVENVIFLKPDEQVRLDAERLGELYLQMGEAGAEEVVCRAIDELACRLGKCHRLWCQQDASALRKSARSLIAIADQIGMAALARVARQVTDAVDGGDPVAVAATLSRLIRTGERSLTAVWDLQDLSV